MLFKPPRMPCAMVGARTVMPRTTRLYSRMRRPCTSNVVETIIGDRMAMGRSWCRAGFRLPSGEPSPEGRQRIVVRIHHPLFERDDRVVGDRDRLWADLGAALGDVAVTDSALAAQMLVTLGLVERMHLVHGRPHQHRGAHEGVVLPVRPQHVAHVLAEEAFDALTEFLRALDLVLVHAPRSVCVVGRTRLKRGNALGDLVIPRHIGHEILHQWDPLPLFAGFARALAVRWSQDNRCGYEHPGSRFAPARRARSLRKR